MARPLRIEFPGAAFHVSSRGHTGLPVVRDDDDRQDFLKSLNLVVSRYQWICHAYCLVPDHYELLIERFAI